VVTFFNGFLRFLKIQKNMTFYFFEMLHTFSRTLTAVFMTVTGELTV